VISYTLVAVRTTGLEGCVHGNRDLVVDDGTYGNRRVQRMEGAQSIEGDRRNAND